VCPLPSHPRHQSAIFLCGGSMPRTLPTEDESQTGTIPCLIGITSGPAFLHTLVHVLERRSSSKPRADGPWKFMCFMGVSIIQMCISTHLSGVLIISASRPALPRLSLYLSRAYLQYGPRRIGHNNVAGNELWSLVAALPDSSVEHRAASRRHPSWTTYDPDTWESAPDANR
jgi:hypothetical protein